MNKNFTGKWVLFAISFVVNCLIWYAVITSDDPKISISLGSIAVELENGDFLHEKGLAYYVESNETISVTVSVSQKKGWLVKPDDIQLTADLKKAEEGTNTVYVQAQIVNNQSIIGNNYKLARNYVTIRTEKLVEKTIPIQVDTSGTPGDGLNAGKCILSQESMKVRVPESFREYVDCARGTVDVSSLEADFEGEIPLVFYDEGGHEIDCDAKQVLPEKDSVFVKVPVGIVKNIEIELPEEQKSYGKGYRCTMLEAERSSQKVIGTEESLADFDKIVITEEALELNRKTESFETEMDLSEYLPEGVSVYDPAEIKLKIDAAVEKLETRTCSIPVSQIRFENLADGYRAEAAENTEIVAEVEGLASELSRLTSEAVNLIADMQGCNPGIWHRNVSIELNTELISDHVVLLTESRKVKIRVEEKS